MTDYVWILQCRFQCSLWVKRKLLDGNWHEVSSWEFQLLAWNNEGCDLFAPTFTLVSVTFSNI